MREIKGLVAAAAAVALLVALAGCGGGGDDGATGIDPIPGPAERAGSGPDLSTGNLLPLQVGNQWTYSVAGSSTPLVQQITGTRAISAGVGFVFASSDQPGDDSVYLDDAQGLRVFPGTGADAGARALGPLEILRHPLQVGAVYPVANKAFGATLDYDGDGLGDEAAFRRDAEVLGVESLATPIGTLANVVHLRSTGVLRIRFSASGQRVDITTVSDDWLAPGIGPVQSHVTSSGDGQAASYQQTLSSAIVGGTPYP